MANVTPKEVGEAGWQKLVDIAKLVNFGEGSSGLLISTTGGFFATNVQIPAKLNVNDNNFNEGRTGIQGTASSHLNDPEGALSDGAAYYFFEKSGNTYKMFCYDINNQKKYVNNISKALGLVESETSGAAFTVAKKDNGFTLKATYS